ncbi:RING-type E3 ubiquitin transferase [Ranunculus cassubicifolius]
MAPDASNNSPTPKTLGSSSSTSSINQSPTQNPNLNPFPSFQNITNFIPIKLQKDNYNLWMSLFLPVLRSFDLMKFVDGSFPCPVPSIPSTDLVGNTTQIPNPDYLSWVKLDQTLLIWMNTTISEDILPYVIGISTSRALWVTLENRLAALSRAHILQLKHRLQNVRKGNQSIALYLQQIKAITDGLAAAGSIVDDIDLVFHILNGLSSEFDSFSTSIRLRDPPVTSDVLHSLLLSEEICLENRLRPQDQTHAFISYPNNSKGSNRTNRGRGNPQFNNNSSSNSHLILSTPPSNQTPHINPNNKCFSQYFTTAKPVCQICQKPNHTALDCYCLDPPYGAHSILYTSAFARLNHLGRILSLLGRIAWVMGHDYSKWAGFSLATHNLNLMGRPNMGWTVGCV